MSIIFVYKNICSNHWILMVIDMANSRLRILDSLRKEQTEYQDMIDIIKGDLVSPATIYTPIS